MSVPRLDFENEIYELEDLLTKLEQPNEGTVSNDE